MRPLCESVQTVSAPVREGADIETEIYERFENMQQAFLKIDTNQDGCVSKSELLQKCLNWNIPISEAERAIAEADLNSDGTLSFNEFAKRFNSSKPVSADGAACSGAGGAACSLRSVQPPAALSRRA